MKLVYCATPSRMVDKTEEILDFVQNQGYAPFHPFLAFPYQRFEGGPPGRENTMNFCKATIRVCNRFWLFGISEGTVIIELRHVLLHNIRCPTQAIPIELFFERFDPQWQKMLKKLRSDFKFTEVDPVKYIRWRLKTQKK